MQCPRCGDNTPGTLSGCARCGAPVDRRPDQQGPQAGGAGQAPLSLDATMLDPLGAPLGAPLPAPAPPAPWASEMTRVEPLGGAGFMGRPGGTNDVAAPSSSGPSADPEATQAWTMPPDDDEPEPPAPPAPAGPQAAGMPEPPPVPSWAGGGSEPSGGPIVPDSWFAEPRSPSAGSAGEQTQVAMPETSGAGAAGTEVWAPGGPAAGPAWGAPAPHDGAAGGGFGEPAADATWQLQPGMPGPQDGGYPGPEGYPQPNGGYPGPAGAYHPDAGYPGPDGAYHPDSGYPADGAYHPDGGYPAPDGYPGPDGAYPAAGGYPGPDGAYPGPDGAYPGPDGGYGHRPAGGRSNKPLAIVVGVLVTVALVAVGVVMWPDGGGEAAVNSSTSATPSNAAQKKPVKRAPSAAARQQAQEINDLLDASADTRNQLGQALAAAAKCRGLPTAIAGFQRVAQRRTNQINRTNALKVDELRNGERLRASLLKSFQLSLQVDQAFLVWAQGAQGCKGRPRQDANYARGNALSTQATVAKKQFTVLWNPVAGEVGLPARTDRQF